MTTQLVLASASPVRRQLLENAGVEVVAMPARIDEDSLKQSLKAEGAGAVDAATCLAETKAVKIGQRLPPGQFVLGCDQLLTKGDQWFDKPQDRAGLQRQLQALRGTEHRLYSAAILMKDGARLFHHVGVARLTMRTFSDTWLDAYCRDVPEDVCQSVGGYHLEGLGVQAFQKIDGDFFTILGLPLLQILQALRDQEILMS